MHCLLRAGRERSLLILKQSDDFYYMVLGPFLWNASRNCRHLSSRAQGAVFPVPQRSQGPRFCWLSEGPRMTRIYAVRRPDGGAAGPASSNARRREAERAVRRASFSDMLYLRVDCPSGHVMDRTGSTGIVPLRACRFDRVSATSRISCSMSCGSISGSAALTFATMNSIGALKWKGASSGFLRWPTGSLDNLGRRGRRFPNRSGADCRPDGWSLAAARLGGIAATGSESAPYGSRGGRSCRHKDIEAQVLWLPTNWQTVDLAGGQIGFQLPASGRMGMVVENMPRSAMSCRRQ